jgi:hypothetical protein
VRNRSRVAGFGITAAGVTIAAIEFYLGAYVLVATLVVAAIVWWIGAGARRAPMRLRKHVMLTAVVTVGFWVCTTTALRFADSSEAEGGSGAASLVAVSPWGREMNPRELMLHGLVATLALAAIAVGVVLAGGKASHLKRRHRRDGGSVVPSPVVVPPE